MTEQDSALLLRARGLRKEYSKAAGLVRAPGPYRRPPPRG